MKKLIALILALLMATALFACTKQDKNDEPQDEVSDSTDDEGWSIVV